jgi:hypothetical protein
MRGTEADYRTAPSSWRKLAPAARGARRIGGVKDARHLDPATDAKFKDIVSGGINADKGMASLKDILGDKQVEQIHDYLNARANEDWESNDATASRACGPGQACSIISVIFFASSAITNGLVTTAIPGSR